MGIFVGITIKFKKRKDYINTFELDVVMISAKEGGDDNLNNFNNNKDYKKIKISKFNKYYGK